MNAIVITSLVVAATLLLGVLIAMAVRIFSNLIDRENDAYSAKTTNYQPAVSLGYMIPLDANLNNQLLEARKLAAVLAAKLPRGANANIGHSGDDNQKTSFDGIDSDPVSAVRMAYFHSWPGLRTGAKAMRPAAIPVKGVAEAVAPVKDSGDLIPGKDYPYIEITEEMAPAEKRKARIANAKAKSAASKAAKTRDVTPGAPIAEPVTQTVAATKTPALATIGEAGEPIPGVDYDAIAITEDMAPGEVRSARIANAKAKSAANKKFKAAGAASAVPASDAVEAIAQPTVQPETSIEESGPSTKSVPANIPAPNYIEISDEMDQDEIRKARIQNAKEKSAYNKALKASGIDPKKVG